MRSGTEGKKKRRETEPASPRIYLFLTIQALVRLDRLGRLGGLGGLGG